MVDTLHGKMFHSFHCNKSTTKIVTSSCRDELASVFHGSCPRRANRVAVAALPHCPHAVAAIQTVSRHSKNRNKLRFSLKRRLSIGRIGYSATCFLAHPKNHCLSENSSYLCTRKPKKQSSPVNNPPSEGGLKEMAQQCPNKANGRFFDSASFLTPKNLF